ncbi:MAG TPA: hypothetical protein VI636_09705 [Candidatus Angelobacter sp.]
MGTNPSPPAPYQGATYDDVLTRLATVSSRLSDILRTIGIGTVLFCWGLFSADKGLPHDVAVHHPLWIVVTAAIAVLGLLFDLLQAAVAYRVANRLRSDIERDQFKPKFYPYQSLLYRSQTFFFYGKSILMPVAAASIVILLFVMVWNPQPVPPAAPCCCCSNPPSPPTPSPNQKTSKLLLLPVPEFTPKNWTNPTNMQKLQKALSQKAEKGDLLLLIGSADCTPIRNNKEKLDNTQLALNRATKVRDLLQAAGFSLEMPPQVLPQYVNCREKSETRAVYPLLLHSAEH